ncbi:MAG: dihydropteroate synthase [Synergistaceae bacterium]
MTPYNVRILNTYELSEVLQKIGADKRSLPYFDAKRKVEVLFISDVLAKAANVIKQEMLSVGGDAAVHAHVIDCKTESTDIILFGSKKQLAIFADKISTMNWWSLPEIANNVRQALLNLSHRKFDMLLPCGKTLSFGDRTLIMGIVNLTDDSFFSESRVYGNSDKALERAVKLAEEGADILDLGAESTRPGSHRVPEEQELQRVIEAVTKIRQALPTMPLSIDTTRASVAEAALKAGADIINDISGLTFDEEIASVAGKYNAPLVIMHIKGKPENMQTMCEYNNIIKDITAFFDSAIAKALSHGVKYSNIILDPGFGFAKNYNQNLFLMKNFNAFDTFGLPILYGVSRKGFLGKATHSDTAPQESLEGTLAITSLCSWTGVDIVRVHDVKENKRIIKMVEAIKGSTNE